MSTRQFSDVSGKEINFEKEGVMGSFKILTLLRPSYFTEDMNAKPMVQEITIDLNSEEVAKVKEVLTEISKQKKEEITETKEETTI